MAMNIENEETCRLVRELAELTGETLTAAVNEAVRERIDRLRRQPVAPLSERLLAIGKDCAGRLSEQARAIDHGDWLYGEDGLPR